MTVVPNTPSLAEMPMSDGLLSIQDRQEALSRAYAKAIAARAGYATYQPDIDRDSVDIGFMAKGAMRPNIHAQLKATINLRKVGDDFAFALSRKNYDDLRPPTQVPRIIIVLGLPRKEDVWLNVSVQRLIIRRCAFWASLRDLPESPVLQQSVTIKIPSANAFNVAALTDLMSKARNGTPL